LQLNDRAPGSHASGSCLRVPSKIFSLLSRPRRITVSPVNRFASQAALSFTGEPRLSTCDVTPGSVTVNASGGQWTSWSRPSASWRP